jgi:transposase-like protein
MRETNTESTRRHRSPAEAERLVRDFEQSGLSRKAFCAARGVALHTLDYYRHRNRVRRRAGGADQLIPVELVDPAHATGGLRVELANGRCLVVEAGFDASHLKRLLAVLEG